MKFAMLYIKSFGIRLWYLSHSASELSTPPLVECVQVEKEIILNQMLMICLKVRGPFSQNGDIYSNDASPPKKS